MELIKAPRGTADLLPVAAEKMLHVEESVRQVAETYGYREIRTPVFEHTELFSRSVGDTTDVVQKEMYTFEDKGGRSITLRPEGTAGVVRAFLEHGLHNETMPQKLYYLTSCYRYEKPQAGRLREFHQFGIECIGATSPAADAEVIGVAADVMALLELENIRLEINSIGCPECRGQYHAALKEYFTEHSAELCGTCLDRLTRNPLRILDCKSPVCSEIAAGAPLVLDYICDDCRTHFKAVQAFLGVMGLEYTVNPTIVRGLDYYTRTVFEFVSDGIGAQGTVCGGGRYDGLIEELGGPSVSAAGFGMGLDRLILLMESQKKKFPEPQGCDLFIASLGEAAEYKAMELANRLRAEGVSALTELTGRSIKAQTKYANKLGARYFTAVGEYELESGQISLKNMKTGDVNGLDIEELAETFTDILSEDFMREFGGSHES